MDERKREDVLSDELDNGWSDADYEEVSGARQGHLHRIIIGGVLAIVVVLILVFMFSDRQPPEVPKEKGAVQLKIPLEDEPAPAMADNVPVLEPVTPPATETGPVYPPSDEPVAAAPAGQQSAMDVKAAAPGKPAPVAVAPEAAPAETRVSPAAPKPAAPAVPAPQAASPAAPQGQDETARQAEREQALQARLAQEQQAAKPAGPDAAPAAKTAAASQPHQPATAKPAANAEAARPEPAPGPGPYVVQLGAFKTRANADHLVTEMSGTGLALRVVEGGGVYKVQSRPYANYEQARQFRSAVQSKAQVAAIIVPAK